MDKVIKEMEENKNIIIEGKFVYELEQQLQRLKAENEKLKEQLNNKDDLINDITNGSIQLQKECERLKEENKWLKEPSMIIPPPPQMAVPIKEVEKYLHALEDIRDIISRTDSQHPASVANMVSVIRREINEVIGAE